MIYRRYDYIRMIQFRDNKSMEIRSIREETTFLSLPLRKNKSYLDCYCCYLTVLNVFVARRERERRRKKKMNRFFIQCLSRFQMKWNRCSYSFVFITPCLNVWACARSCIERKKRGEIVRICSFARLAHQQQEEEEEKEEEEVKVDQYLSWHRSRHTNNSFQIALPM